MFKQIEIKSGATLPKTVICVAPTGARRGKSDHPSLPISVEEIVSASRACFEKGAHALHLHVRDMENAHSIDPGLYREAIEAISHDLPQLAIQITTESAGRFEVADQLACLKELVPQAASVSVREAHRDPRLAARLYAFADEAEIEIQHILYDRSDLELLREAMRTGLVPETMRDVILVFGRYAPPRPAQVEDVAHFVAALGQEFPNWMACAFGSRENSVLLEVARLGGHVRVGFENNIHRPDRTLALDNAENVARFQTSYGFLLSCNADPRQGVAHV